MLCQPKSFRIKHNFFLWCFQFFFFSMMLISRSFPGLELHMVRARHAKLPKNLQKHFLGRENHQQWVQVHFSVISPCVRLGNHSEVISMYIRSSTTLKMSEMCACVCEWTQKESCDSLPSSNNDTVLKGSAWPLSSTCKWQASSSQHRITFVFFNEMLSILVHIICLGVLQNGAKYHFRVR